MYVTTDGNEKLGKKVYVINRPVGVTCPSSCALLHYGCYAEKTENRFSRAKRVGFLNLKVKTEELVGMIRDAYQNKKDIRIHERGDFVYKGKSDRKYIQAWKKAVDVSLNIPYIWVYTHVYQKSIAQLQRKKVSVYASVHNTEDVKKAKAKGFKLFAWAIDIPKKKGGSKDFPAKIDLPILGSTLVCPEQRFGRKKITCDKCRWCIEGKGNVVFLKS